MSLNFLAGSVSIGGGLQSESFQIVDASGNSTIDLSGLNSQVANVEANVSIAQQDISNLETLTTSHTSTLSSHTSSLTSQASRISVLETANSDIQARLSAAEAELATVNFPDDLSEVVANINVLKGNVVTLQTEIDTAETQIASVTANANALAELVDSIPSANLQAQITQEIADRQSADTTLQSNIDQVATNLASNVSTINTSITTLENTVNNQISSDLANLQTTVSTDISSAIQSVRNDLASNVTAITNAYESADTTLQSNIDQVASDLTSGLASIRTELQSNVNAVTSSYESADAGLQSSIDSLSTTVTNNYNNLNSAITSEASTRASADSTLTSSINSLSTTVTSNYNSLSTSISNEANTRSTAITSINSSITSLQNDKLDKTGGTITGNLEVQGIILSGYGGTVYSSFKNGNLQISDGSNVMVITPTSIEVSGPEANTSVHITPSLSLFDIDGANVNLKSDYTSLKVNNTPVDLFTVSGANVSLKPEYTRLLVSGNVLTSGGGGSTPTYEKLTASTTTGLTNASGGAVNSLIWNGTARMKASTPLYQDFAWHNNGRQFFVVPTTGTYSIAVSGQAEASSGTAMFGVRSSTTTFYYAPANTAGSFPGTINRFPFGFHGTFFLAQGELIDIVVWSTVNVNPLYLEVARIG